MRYMLITEWDQHKFNARISGLLQDGWQLYGSPNRTSDGWFVQAVTHEKAETTH